MPGLALNDYAGLELNIGESAADPPPVATLKQVPAFLRRH
jgi:hypothetical protein